MKHRKLLLLVALSLVAILACVFVACDTSSGLQEEGSGVVRITFNTQGGSTVKSIAVSVGSTITLPSNPTKEGYVFDGWFFDKECSHAFDISTKFSKNTILYAKWIEDESIPQTCSVTFIVDDDEYDVVTLTRNETVQLPTSPVKICHIFDGWYTDETFVVEFDEEQPISSDITVYAKWIANHVAITDHGYSADCENTGLSDGSHCEVCGSVLVEQQVLPISHSCGEWTAEIPATCVSTGTKGYYQCTDCKKYLDANFEILTDLTIDIDKNAHALTHHNIFSPTCTSAGWNAYDTCSRCDYSTYTEIPALGHDCTEYEAQDPTCTEVGWNAYEACSRCDYSTYSEISKLGHTGGTASCTEKAICERCNEKYGEALGHDKIYHGAENPTCTEVGWNAYETCSRCDYSTYSEIPEYGHAYGTWVNKVPATCIAPGVLGHYECSRCNEYFDATYNTITELTIQVDGNAHDIVHHDSKAKTCTEVGWYAYDTCSRCAYSTYMEISASHAYADDGICDECGYFESGLEFTLNDDGESWSVSGIGTFSGTDLVIPAVNYDTKPVTGIAVNAFRNCTTLTSVTIPDSVTSIGGWAFQYCVGFTILTIPDSVKSVGAGAFYTCRGLESVNVGNGVTSVGEYAFCGCISLESVVIGKGLKNIGSNAFWKDSAIENFTVSSDNTKYHSDGNCVIETATKTIVSGCKNSVIPTDGSVTSIGDKAFYQNTALTNITIPEVITSIGVSAFEGCNALASMKIGDGVTSIGESAFSNCTGLASVTFSDSVESIGQWAFSDCTGLTSITVSDNVKYIGNEAFSGCTGLANISLGNGITRMGCFVFDDTAWYENQSNGSMIYIGNVLYGYKGTIMSGSYASINAGTTCIAGGAFYYQQGLSSVIIPNSVTSIGAYAFYGCIDLENVTIPDNVTIIGDCAFYGCYDFTTITIPNNVTSIGFCAFASCTGVTDLVIPDSVTSIGEEAFYYCTSLKNVTIGDGVTSIGEFAFAGCSKLTSITVPDNVQVVGDGVFRNCTALTTVTIGSGVTSMGYSIFRGCASLETLTIPFVGDRAGVKNDDTFQYPFGYIFGNQQYDGSFAVTQNYYGHDNSSLVSDVFYFPMSLKTVTVTGGMIPYGAFFGCQKIETVIIGSGVTSIEKGAFAYCYKLANVTIMDGVTSIDELVFLGCYRLTSVVIPKSVTSINANIFYGCSAFNSLTFEDPTGWYTTGSQWSWENRKNGTEVDLSNPSANVTYFKSTYSNNYWYKL